jgi:hypothetical protein
VRSLVSLLPLVPVLVAATCGGEAGTAGTAGTAAEAGAPATGRVVDSVFPIAEEIRRFQATLADTPVALSEGAPTLDLLVERFLGAVERADTAALRPLVLSRAEFGVLYYPHTRFTERPYELSPSLLWFQVQNGQSRGLTRLFQRLAGRDLRRHGYRCEDEPRAEGPNRVWEECRVVLEGAGADTASLRLFGTVLERDGVFKFVSLANEL